MKKILAGLLLISYGLCSGIAAASTITESGAAGTTMDTAMILPSGTTQVNGIFETDSDYDLFKFFVGTSQVYDIYLAQIDSFDPNLILFNSSGQGLEGDDDGGSIIPGSSVLDSLITRNLDIGWYFIGVGPNNMFGYTSGGSEFIDNDDGPLASPTTETLGYIGGYVGSGHGYDGYRYVLTFTPAVGGSAVPEPATMLLLGFGLLGLAGVSRTGKHI